MSLSLQSHLKQQTLLEQLTHFGKVKPEQIISPLQAASTGYRRKARLGVKFVIKKDKMLVGLEKNPAAILPTSAAAWSYTRK